MVLIFWVNNTKMNVYNYHNTLSTPYVKIVRKESWMLILNML